ncbi:Hypothetical Protein FCC1311_082892 [Hondaea fermentalgiana]|uniref:Uncharacterized protein n=1 Tax=Hondaea fermentalgiana TaxID=2315210 RepID=A0A2R5GVW6_9STRA|nr:Hypothetical Protein FCC1311_082892 [Hondaea fermentalgiana]|eukprot:GBG32064.1 Hypothetical Protein FCC1311_082892 [Hondaea fermentalgiana]
MDFSAGKAPAWAWSVGTVVAYLGLYTAYSKTEKKLKSDGLLDVVAVRKSADHSAVEMNKVLALAGLTTLGVSLSPYAIDVVDTPYDLTVASTVMLSVHSMYSVYKYYGSPNIPEASSFLNIVEDAKSESSSGQVAFKRKVSVLTGMAAAGILDAWLLGFMPMSYGSAISALTLGTLHFYFMEVTYNGSLAVRPFGFLAFAVPIVSGIGLAVRYLTN